MEYSLPTNEALKEWASNKVAIVTGGAQGIGFAIAQLLTGAGVKVVIADVNDNIGKDAASRCGHGTIFIKCDVTSWEAQVHLFQETLAAHGRLDLVCSNAGINPELLASPQDSTSSGDSLQGPQFLHSGLKKIIDINFVGMAYTLDLALQHMSKTGGGRVILTGSIGSYVGVSNQAVYSASKHAVLGLLRAVSARSEVLQSGIAISLVAPSLTATDMTKHIMSFIPPEVLVSSPEDVAGAVGILCTQPLEKVNGKSLVVQGSTYTEAEDSFTQCWMSIAK